jgi:hypothetical protein
MAYSPDIRDIFWKSPDTQTLISWNSDIGFSCHMTMSAENSKFRSPVTRLRSRKFDTGLSRQMDTSVGNFVSAFRDTH